MSEAPSASGRLRWIALVIFLVVLGAGVHLWVGDATGRVTLEGVVTTAGAPVPGATVWAEVVTEGNRWHMVFRTRRVEALTDESGRYRLEIPGELGVRVGAWNQAGHGSVWREIEDLVPGETRRVDISIRRQ